MKQITTSAIDTPRTYRTTPSLLPARASVGVLMIGSAMERFNPLWGSGSGEQGRLDVSSANGRRSGATRELSLLALNHECV
jgi:hypothetical protein